MALQVGFVERNDRVVNFGIYENCHGTGWYYYDFVLSHPAFDLLCDGRKVLFVGTPCQVAGLKQYLQYDDPNLFTCDIICHGVPSPKAFHSYINYLNKRGELMELNHRDKKIGWKGYCTSAIISNKRYQNSGWLKAYNVMFSHGLINRSSCFSCPYANYNRPSDITIGDWWGVEKHRKQMIDKLGISLILVNTKKGAAILEKSTSEVDLIELQKEETFQNSLLHPMKKPTNRLACLVTIEKSYEKAAKEYGEWNLKGYCKEFLRHVSMHFSGF